MCLGGSTPHVHAPNASANACGATTVRLTRPRIHPAIKRKPQARLRLKQNPFKTFETVAIAPQQCYQHVL
jgi:hypothetical protein